MGMTSLAWTLSPSWYHVYLLIENGDGGAWKIGTVEPGKWGRWSLENRWWSLENGIGGSWKMETVELGKWGSLGSLIWSCLCNGIEDLFSRNVFNWLDTLSILSWNPFISKKRGMTLMLRLLSCRWIWVFLDLLFWSCIRRGNVDLFNRNGFKWLRTVELGK